MTSIEQEFWNRSAPRESDVQRIQPGPIAAAPDDWLGLPIALHQDMKMAIYRDVEAHCNNLAVVVSGEVEATYVTGSRSHEIHAGPGVLSTFGQGTYWHRFYVQDSVCEILHCRRRLNFDPPCRLNFDPGMEAGIEDAGC